VEVSKYNHREIRLPSILVAVLITLTGTGIKIAQAEEPQPKPSSSKRDIIVPVITNRDVTVPTKIVQQSQGSKKKPIKVTQSQGSKKKPIKVTQSQGSKKKPGQVTQSQGSKKKPGQVSQSTPEQETPNQLQFDITPGTPNPENTPGTPSPNNTPPPNTPPTPGNETPPPNLPPFPGNETPPPNTPPTPGNENTPSPQPSPGEPEASVLVAEIAVNGAEGDLQNQIYNVIRTRPGTTTTRSQLQEDVNAIYALGYFAKVGFTPEDTSLGVRVTFNVEVNPVLRSVKVNTVPTTDKGTVIPAKVIEDTFSPQYGKILNLNELQDGIKKLNEWYKENGYDLAQVIAVPQVSPEGEVQLTVAEGVIEDIQVSFLSKEGEETNDDGKKVRGKTRDFIITREVEQKPGDIFNRKKAEQDLRRVYGLGIFDDVRLQFKPGQDPSKVVLVVNVIEKNTGSVGLSGGISSASGLFGAISYQQQNLGGNNQRIGGEIQVGQRELLFDVNFSDPWIAGDPYRTSYSVNAFRRRSISLIFDGGPNDVNLPNEDLDTPRVLRLGGGISFSRQLSRDVFNPPEWRASLGLQYQQVSIRDADGELAPKDQLGNDLSFSGKGKDDLLTLNLGAVRDRRNNPLTPTQGSLLRFGLDQSIPIGQGNILLSRLRGSYSYYIPVKFTKFGEGAQALAFNIQGGTVLGDLPPYEAFLLGGTNSVRGYDEGDVGSGRSFVQATAEYRFPLFSIVGATLFVDAASDLGSGKEVPGNPAGVRGKPGSGFGYGAGVRIQTPLGPLRIDYGFNDEGDSRLHFGIGERF
jgi:outer membrane protein insertion porin family